MPTAKKMLLAAAVERNWIAQEEVVVRDLEEYHFALEEFRRGEDQMVFVHLTVHEWTLSTFKKILREWKLFRECVTCPLYAVGGVEEPQRWEKFVSRLGFTPLAEVICENGAKRRLFIHTIKNNKAQNERQISTDQHSERLVKQHHEPVVCADAVSDAGV